jgi:hypothetical protein
MHAQSSRPTDLRYTSTLAGALDAERDHLWLTWLL